MKEQFTMVFVIISILLFINKRLGIVSSWKKTTGTVISNNKLLINNLYEVKYLYKDNNIDYHGNFYTKKKMDLKKIKIYYNKNNPSLSVKEIPFNMEDYLLIISALFGIFYLYIYSCELCDSPQVPLVRTITNTMPKMPSLPNIDFRSKLPVITPNKVWG